MALALAVAGLHQRRCRHGEVASLHPGADRTQRLVIVRWLLALACWVMKGASSGAASMSSPQLAAVIVRLGSRTLCTRSPPWCVKGTMKGSAEPMTLRMTPLAMRRMVASAKSFLRPKIERPRSLKSRQSAAVQKVQSIAARAGAMAAGDQLALLDHVAQRT